MKNYDESVEIKYNPNLSYIPDPVVLGQEKLMCY